MVGSVPPDKYLLQLFTDKNFEQLPDVIFIGTQECEVSLFWAFFWGSKPRWE